MFNQESCKPFILGSKGQGHEAQKTEPAWVGSLHSFDCGRLVVFTARRYAMLARYVLSSHLSP